MLSTRNRRPLFVLLGLLVLVAVASAAVEGSIALAVQALLLGTVALILLDQATRIGGFGVQQSRADARRLLRRLRRLEERLDATAGRLDEELARLNGELVRMASVLSDMRTGIDAAMQGAREQAVTKQDAAFIHRSLAEQAASLAEHRADFATFRDLLKRAVGDSSASLRLRTATDVAALLALYGDGRRAMMPAPEGWSMSPRLLDEVSKLVALLPSSPLIVELGSGVSTSWIGKALELRGDGRLVSYEHDSGYAELTARQVQTAGVGDRVEIRCAPLVPVEIEHTTYSWYQGFEDLHGISLLVVDGPPGSTGPQARLPAIPLLLSRMLEGGVVVLDDSQRRDERATLQHWQALSQSGRRVVVVRTVDRATILRVEEVEEPTP